MTTLAPSAGMPRSTRGCCAQAAAKSCEACSVWGAVGGLGLLPSLGKYAATLTVPAIKNKANTVTAGRRRAAVRSLARRAGIWVMGTEDAEPETMKMTATAA